MAFQNARAKGDAPKTGAPGPTPAPVRKYATDPAVVGRSDSPAYGAAKNIGPSSVDPGTTDTSPLADDLRRVAADSDAGDLIGDIATHGTSRNTSLDLQSTQTRNVSDQMIAPSHGMKRQTSPSKIGDVEVGTLPSKLGASAAPLPKEPNA
jgi:hypothetical protein